MRDVKDAVIRKKEIMEVALNLFLKKGFLETTTQDIVDAMKISRGLLYYHFNNKEDILYSLIIDYSEPVIQKIDKICDNNDIDAVSKLDKFFEATIISAKKITPESTVMQKTLDLKVNHYLMDKFSHYMIEKLTIRFSQIIKQGIIEKSFEVEDPYSTAYFLISGYIFVGNSMTYENINKNNLDPNTFLTSFKTILIRSLKIKNSKLKKF